MKYFLLGKIFEFLREIISMYFLVSTENIENKDKIVCRLYCHIKISNDVKKKIRGKENL